MSRASTLICTALGAGWMACCALLMTAAHADERRIDLGAFPGPRTMLSAEGVRELDPGARHETIRPGEYIVVRWAEEARPSIPAGLVGSEAWALPYGFIGVTREGREVRFRPVVETSGGLFLSGDASGFTGLIHVGLQDLGDPTAAYELPQPISLLVSARADEVSPRQLTIGHTNLPFADVTIRAQDPADPLEIAVRASGTDDRATVSLPVVRPRLEVSVERPRIQGFGLETSPLTVRAVGLRDPAGRIVTLTTGAETGPVGSLDAMQVRLDEQGVGGTTLRSASVGRSTVAASSPPLAPASLPVHFVWPVPFLLAAVLGGLAGAFLGRRPPAQDGKRHGLPYTLGVGALTGIVAVVLYAVGVNVLPVQPVATAGEALVFAIAAVAGYVGLRL